MFRKGCQTMLLLLIPVLLIIWGFWWIHKPPAYPKDPDNMGYFFIGYRTQWALKSRTPGCIPMCAMADGWSGWDWSP